MEIPSKYSPQEIEDKWYAYWMQNGYFHSEPDSRRKPYTVVIPPPNVTGVLHMGHMMNNTIQDLLVRRARMKGFNACWVPGTDHASIATEAAQIHVGDTIVTTSHSSRFPPGLMIGTVADFELNNATYYDVRVKLHTDIAALNNVVVIKYLDAEERETLENDVSMTSAAVQ